jgi:hypothetical protein
VIAYRSVRAAIGRGAAALLCVAAVPVAVLALVHALFGIPLSAYRPIGSDEVAYWHQAATFSEVGFRGGYYTVDELTNPSGMTPFGPHGAGFAVLYGLFGAVFGWSRHSVVLLNLIAIAGAVALWVALTKLSLPRLLLAGVMLLTYWHVVFWAPTGMQESLHQAGAIVLAGCFAAVLSSRSQRWTVVLGWVVLGVLSFIRPSWIMLLPVWAVATSRNSRWPVMAATVGGSLLYGAVILFAYSSTTAPYGAGFFFLRAASQSLPVQALIDNLQYNLQRIARTDQYRAIELVQRYQYVAFLLATASATAWGIGRRVPVSGKSWRVTPHLPIAAIVLAAALAAMLLLYEFAGFAEHRVLSAFLLFGAMLCLAAPGRLGPLLVAGLVLSNVMTTRTALTEFEVVWHDRFEGEEQDLAELERAIGGRVIYQPGTQRWCNTLLTSAYPPSLIAVPAGIGLSVLQKPELLMIPPRSRYMLLDDRVQAAFTRRLNLQTIASLPYGTLYVNRDAPCGPQ